MRKPFYALILPLFLFPAVVNTDSIKPFDDYSHFVRLTYRAAKRWNPDAHIQEVNRYAWSTFNGCHNYEPAALLYNCVVVKESGFLEICNSDGFGFSGARWECIWRLCRKAGIRHATHKWCQKHPYQVNQILAEQFYLLFFTLGPEEAVKRWHRGFYWNLTAKSRKESVRYWEEIKQIQKTLGDMG